MGLPNKSTADLRERIETAMGAEWCPVVALARIAADSATSLALRVRCLTEIAPYLESRRKFIEVSEQPNIADNLKAARERVAADRLLHPIVQAVPQAAESPRVTTQASPISIAGAPQQAKPVAPPARISIDIPDSDPESPAHEPYNPLN